MNNIVKSDIRYNAAVDSYYFYTKYIFQIFEYSTNSYIYTDLYQMLLIVYASVTVTFNLVISFHSGMKGRVW